MEVGTWRRNLGGSEIKFYLLFLFKSSICNKEIAYGFDRLKLKDDLSTVEFTEGYFCNRIYFYG